MAAVISKGAIANFSENFGDSDEYIPSPRNQLDEFLFVPDLSYIPEHLWWNCRIDSVVTNVPPIIQALIDHRCPLVLISPELVDVLSLRIRKLHKQIDISPAFTCTNNNNSSTELTEYVWLPLCSTDYVFSSRVMNTIICPNLHTPLILGMTFLEGNGIVIDHEKRTAVHKASNYDLFNPMIPRKPEPVNYPKRRRTGIKKAKELEKEIKKKRKSLVSDLEEHLKKIRRKETVTAACEPDSKAHIIRFLKI